MAGKGQSASAILQKLQSVSDTVDSNKNELGKVLAELEKVQDTLKNMNTVFTAMEHRLGQIETSSKSTGTKRAPRATGTGTAKTSDPTPTGSRFHSSSFAWLGQNFRADPKATREKFFSQEHIDRVNVALEKNETYIKKDPSKATTESKKQQFIKARIGLEFKAYWSLVQKDVDLKNKIDQDYQAEKAEFNKNNQTPAKKDDGDANGEENETPESESS